MKNFLICFITAIVCVAGCAKEKKADPPQLLSVSPSKAAYGESITLTGNFLKSVNKIVFGGSQSESPVSASESQVVVLVPKMTPVITNIKVQSPDGESSTLSFEVLQPFATINSVLPIQARRGETLLISGENLDQVKTIRFNDGFSSEASFSREGANLKVLIPNDAEPGQICLSNTTEKTCTLTDYPILIEPIIASLSRDKGVKDEVIEIKGKYLQNATVRFGNVAVVPSSNDGTTLRVGCPEFSTVGQLKLTVSTAGGTVSRDFTGAPAAKIASAVPNGIIPGSALTLKGINYYQIQSILLPGGATVSAASFIKNEPGEVTFIVPDKTPAGAIRIVNQYGSGEKQDLSLVSGGSGLNADNIANSPGSIGSVGSLNRTCDPFVFKQYSIEYLPAGSTTPPAAIPGGPAFAGTYSISLYIYYRCDAQCQCSEADKSRIYGSFVKIGGSEYRQMSGGLGGFSCPASDIGFSKSGPYPECKQAGQVFAYDVKIQLELQKKGNIIENDVYTGFAIVELSRSYVQNDVPEIFYGNKTKTGEYILESNLGKNNRIKLRLD